MKATILPDKLSFGLLFPLEGYQGSIPKMKNQVSLAQLAEQLGFTALWARDVPLHHPSFGDAGQLYDPWVYLTYIATKTKTISLGTASVILPLRHPIHTAKSASSIDVLSNGRLLLGVASGDRAIEYTAFAKSHQNRASLFRDSFQYIKTLLEKDFPKIENNFFGTMNSETDLLPKPLNRRHIPMYVTGHSGQQLDWIAQNADGWMYYPRNPLIVENNINNWRNLLEKHERLNKPYIQSLYIDLIENPNAKPVPIHLGFRVGSNYLIEILKMLESLGVNHIIFVLKYATRPVNDVIEELGQEVLPNFK